MVNRREGALPAAGEAQNAADVVAPGGLPQVREALVVVVLEGGEERKPANLLQWIEG